MQTLQEIVDRCKRIAFFGGAGVSTASGIPDFRGKDGLYAQRFGALFPADAAQKVCERDHTAGDH